MVVQTLRGNLERFFSVATKWISMNYCTPQNRTCNLQKSSFFEKENHLPDLHFLEFMSTFRGCI